MARRCGGVFFLSLLVIVLVTLEFSRTTRNVFDVYQTPLANVLRVDVHACFSQMTETSELNLHCLTHKSSLFNP